MPLRRSAAASAIRITAAIVRACSSSHVARGLEQTPGPLARDEQEHERDGERQQRSEREEEPGGGVLGGGRVELRDVLQRDRDERRPGSRAPRRRRRPRSPVSPPPSGSAPSSRPGVAGPAAAGAARIVHTSSAAPAITSTIATHVFGVDGSRRRRNVAEHEGGDDADRERRRQRAEVEPEAGAQRPLAEHEREDRERQRRRREHRRERDQNELEVDPAHAAYLHGLGLGFLLGPLSLVARGLLLGRLLLRVDVRASERAPCLPSSRTRSRARSSRRGCSTPSSRAAARPSRRSRSSRR